MDCTVLSLGLDVFFFNLFILLSNDGSAFIRGFIMGSGYDAFYNRLVWAFQVIQSTL